MRAYSKTFWERHTELADHDRIIKNIGESPLSLAPPASCRAFVSLPGSMGGPLPVVPWNV